MIVSALLCAAVSVAFGFVSMLAAGAPRRYLLVNAAALAVGALASIFVSRRPLRDRTRAGAATIVVGLVLLATARFGIQIDGATRWISIGGISLQPSLILLPSAMVMFARTRGPLAAIGLAIAALALAMQPDRAMASTLAAGLFALRLHRREAPVTVALAIALAAVGATLLQPDAVAPVPFVERVVASAFAFHVVAGVAVVAGLAVMLVPAALGWRAHNDEREVFAVFGAAWLAVILCAILGNYPTPLVGYGSSAILGYCLSAAVLPPRARA